MATSNCLPAREGVAALADLLRVAARALAETSTRLDRVDHAVARSLGRRADADHADHAEDAAALQGLDLAVQETAALARFLSNLSTATPPDCRCSAEALVEGITIEALAGALSGVVAAAPAASAGECELF